MLQRVYGLNSEEADRLESVLLGTPSLPCMVAHPLLDRIFMADKDNC
jgi:hypothetical protein